MKKDSERIEFYLNNVEFEKIDDSIVCRVRSFSKPNRKHLVVITKYGAVCDCQGVLHLLHKKFCIHVEAVLNKLGGDHNFGFEVIRMRENSYYLKTGTFFDEFGGLTLGETTLIYGPDGSGKTQALLTLTAKLSSQNKKVLFVLTEGTSLYASRRIQQLNGNLKNVMIKEFKDEPRFHVFFGGDIHSSLDYYFLEEKIGGKELSEKRRNLTTNAKSWEKLEDLKENFDVVIVDSITRFYSLHSNVMKPQDRLRVASVFGGNINIYDNYVHKIFEPTSMIWSAWLRSGTGEILSRSPKQIEKAEEDVQRMIHVQDRKEWLGPEALGHTCKIIYKILPEGAGKCSFTQIRGEYMGKKVVCKITSEGVMI